VFHSAFPLAPCEATAAVRNQPLLERASGRPRRTGTGVGCQFGACVLALALAVPATALAQDPAGYEYEERSPWSEAGVGLACVGASLFYSTAKVLYAGIGTLTGVTAYALTGGRGKVFQRIINPALRGDYIVTPAHLARQTPLVFVGPDPEALDELDNPTGVGSYPENGRYPEDRTPGRYPPEPAPNRF